MNTATARWWVLFPLELWISSLRVLQPAPFSRPFRVHSAARPLARAPSTTQTPKPSATVRKPKRIFSWHKTAFEATLETNGFFFVFSGCMDNCGSCVDANSCLVCLDNHIYRNNECQGTSNLCQLLWAHFHKSLVHACVVTTFVLLFQHVQVWTGVIFARMNLWLWQASVTLVEGSLTTVVIVQVDFKTLSRVLCGSLSLLKLWTSTHLTCCNVAESCFF